MRSFRFREKCEEPDAKKAGQPGLQAGRKMCEKKVLYFANFACFAGCSSTPYVFFFKFRWAGGTAYLRRPAVLPALQRLVQPERAHALFQSFPQRNSVCARKATRVCLVPAKIVLKEGGYYV